MWSERPGLGPGRSSYAAAPVACSPMQGSADPDPGFPEGLPPSGRQVIPRPARAYAGVPAPWAALPAGRRRGLGLPLVRAAVEAHHRGLVAEERVTFDGFPDPGAPAAVLVPLFESVGETRVVLTRRAA